MRIRQIPILPLFGFVFCGHVFSSTANSENMFHRGEKRKYKKIFLCLPANCCQRFQSWTSVDNFLFLRDYCMKIKKRVEKIKDNVPPVSLPIYNRNCLKYFLTCYLNCLETNMRYERKTLPKRQIDGLQRKQELFHYIHSLCISPFQSNTSVKETTVNKCTRKEAVARKSGLNGKALLS